MPGASPYSVQYAERVHVRWHCLPMNLGTNHSAVPGEALCIWVQAISLSVGLIVCSRSLPAEGGSKRWLLPAQYLACRRLLCRSRKQMALSEVLTESV